MSFAEQVESFLSHLEHERRCSPHTVAAYSRDLSALVAFVGDETIDAYLLRAFLAERANHVSNSSLARQIASIRSLFRFLRKRGVLRQNPASSLRSPKRREKLPNFLTVEDALRVVESDPLPACVTRSERSPRDAHRSARDRALVEVLYATGVRVSECTGIDLSDIDLDNQSMRVVGKGNKERHVPLGDAAIQAIRDYLPERSRWLNETKAVTEALFVGRKDRLSVRQVQNIVQRMGRDGASRSDLHPHALRHTFATHLLDAGADLRSIQSLLGHASLSTTQRYTHVSLDQMKSVYDRAHPLERKSGVEPGDET